MQKIVITFLLGFSMILGNMTSLEANEREPLESFGNYFDGFQGTFVLYDESRELYTIYNPEQSLKRLTPCSSSKIYNALIGLETGVIADENFVIQWDGTPQPMAMWEKDQTLASAISGSVVWYYKEFIHQVGKERAQWYYDEMDYGNRDISGGQVFVDPKGDPFWIRSSLKINAIEQVDLLTKFYKYDLPFSKRNIEIVKKCIILSDKDGIVFSGKTGSGSEKGKYIVGWFVGSIEKDGKRYNFATNIEGTDGASGGKARGISIEILKDMGLLN